MSPRIHFDKKRVGEFCRLNHIRRLSLFGSVIRDDFRPESDVDVLVEFEPEAKVGFFRMAGMESDLSQIFGRKVDMRTPLELSRYFRADVMKSAEVQYAQE